MPQIENIATVDILDEYLAVPGIDAVAIGPNDMSGTAGVYPNRYHPDHHGRGRQDLRRRQGARRSRLPRRQYTGGRAAGAGSTKGVRLLTVAGDLDLVVSGARNALKATKDVLTG